MGLWVYLSVFLGECWRCVLWGACWAVPRVWRHPSGMGPPEYCSLGMGKCVSWSISYSEAVFVRALESFACKQMLRWLFASLSFHCSMSLSERPKEGKIPGPEQDSRKLSQETCNIKEAPKPSSKANNVVSNALVRGKTPSYQLSPRKCPAANKNKDWTSQQQQNSIKNYFQPCTRKRSVVNSSSTVSPENMVR